MRTLCALLLVAVLVLIPASVFAGHPTYAQVKVALYIDGNGNGSLDWSGDDICVHGNGQTLDWLLTETANTNINTLVQTSSHWDYAVTDYDTWYGCLNETSTAYSIPDERYYTYSGCGPYQETVWIGSISSHTQYLNVVHRTNSLEPSC